MPPPDLKHIDGPLLAVFDEVKKPSYHIFKNIEQQSKTKPNQNENTHQLLLLKNQEKIGENKNISRKKNIKNRDVP